MRKRQGNVGRKAGVRRLIAFFPVSMEYKGAFDIVCILVLAGMTPKREFVLGHINITRG